MSESMYAVCHDLKKNNACVTMVNLNSACLGNDGARMLASALKSNTKAVVLFLNHNNFQGQAVAWKQLSAVLAQHPALTHLYLSQNPDLGNHGITVMAQAFSKHSTGDKCCSKLRVLKLSQNNLGDVAIRALSWWLAEPWCGLQTLDLQKNPAIGSIGMQAMARALKRNATLHTMDLKECSNPALDDDCQGSGDCNCCWRAQMAHTLEQGNTTLCRILMDHDALLPPPPDITEQPSHQTRKKTPCHDRLAVYLTLNRWGRQHFGRSTVTPSLWTRVLARHRSPRTQPISNSLLFHLIRARPDLVSCQSPSWSTNYPQPMEVE